MGSSGPRERDPSPKHHGGTRFACKGPLLKRFPLKLNRSSTVMRRLDPRIHLLAKEDGLPGQARQ
jgi:hypothetical protein